MPRRSTPHLFAAKVGTRVRELRLKKNMSLDDLAKASSVGKGHLSSLERGHAVMNLETAAKIARGLQIEVLDMFVFPEDEPRHAFIERTRKMSASELRKCVVEVERVERAAAANDRNERRWSTGSQ